MSDRQKRIEALRAERERLSEELRNKLNRAGEKADEKQKIQLTMKAGDILNKRAMAAEKWELEEARAEDKAEESLALEQFRHEIRQAERMPNFEDYRMRAELDYLIRMQELLAQNQISNLDMERRITESRHSSKIETKRLVLIAALEHIRAEHAHRHAMEILGAESESELLKAEQAQGHRAENDRSAHVFKTVQDEQGHKHRIAQDDNASRLRVSEIFSAKFIDRVFAQMADDGKVMGHSRDDVEALIAELERQGDRHKR